MNAFSCGALNRNKRQFFLFLLVLFPGLFLWRLSATAFSGAGLFIDEAQYWGWSRELAWGYFSKPPVLAGLIRISTALAGDEVIGVRWLIVLMWGLTPIILWRLVWEMLRDASITGLSDEQRLMASAWSAALTSATLVSALIGQLATTDGPLLFFWAVLIWIFWRAQRQAQRPWLWILWGIVLALATLSKYTAVVLLISAVWLAFRHPQLRLWRGLSLALVVFFLCMLPHLLWNHAHHWPTLRHTVEILTVQETPQNAKHIVSMGRFFLGQMILIGPVLLFTGFFWIHRYVLHQQSAPQDKQHHVEVLKLIRWVGVWAWPIWLIACIQALLGRAQINWPAPAVLALAAMMALWRSNKLPLNWNGPWAVLLWGTLLGSIISLGGDWKKNLALQQAGPSWDIWSRARGWDAAFTALIPHIQRYPEVPIVTSERAVMAHAAYAWRHHSFKPQIWRINAEPQNHYELFNAFRVPTTAQKDLGVLWIGTQPTLPKEAMVSFSPSPALLDVHSDSGRHLYIWRVYLR